MEDTILLSKSIGMRDFSSQPVKKSHLDFWRVYTGENNKVCLVSKSQKHVFKLEYRVFHNPHDMQVLVLKWK